MTFEEMQQIIQQMLAVQRELQDSQLKLLEQTQQHERILDRLIKYSLTTELDKLDLEEKKGLKIASNLKPLDCGNISQKHASLWGVGRLITGSFSE